MFSKVMLLDTAVPVGELHLVALAFCWLAVPQERTLISSAEKQD